VILPGVTLEEGASIGAMSLVTKSTDPWSVYFGIPAKRLKSRKRELLALEQAYLQEEFGTSSQSR
jgi:acetyltransferase-like isoleucine patch superfamily enzyme